jgi:hypothetical protein
MGTKPPPLPRTVFDYEPRLKTVYSATEVICLCGPGALCWMLYVVGKFIGDENDPHSWVNLPSNQGWTVYLKDERLQNVTWDSTHFVSRR